MDDDIDLHPPKRRAKRSSHVYKETPPEIGKARERIREILGNNLIPLERGLNLDNDDDDDDVDSPWMKNVKRKVNRPRRRAHTSRPCTIFKVQHNVRNCNPDAYTPLLVSIGPYHHKSSPSRDSSFIAMENHKWLCLRRLLFRHRSRRSATELLDKCLLAMKSLDADIRSCYSESLDEFWDVHSLALVMLLDGCFILHLLLKQQNLEDHVSNKDQDSDDDDDHDGGDDHVVEDGEILLARGEEGDEKMEEEPLLQTLWIWKFVLYDLLKLENQIPFFVLTTLFDLLKAPSDEDVDLIKLVFKLFSDIHPSNSETFPELGEEANRTHHLLHLFHSTIVPPKKDQQIKIDDAVKAPEWIPNATELQRAGVKFVKKKNASSFWDVSFNSNGTMEIPELCLYDYTDTLFRNLIAFEQCYPDTRTCITIYAAFMDCIIDTPKDAQLLHLKGILSNRLGTDEAAADLFNKLCYQIHYAMDQNFLYELLCDVNRFHQSRWNQWRAKLMRDYFSNPWAIISLIAALFLLLLTVEQAFFAAYSYFRPSS